jgi:hypothetical protein
MLKHAFALSFLLTASIAAIATARVPAQEQGELSKETRQLISQFKEWANTKQLPEQTDIIACKYTITDNSVQIQKRKKVYKIIFDHTSEPKNLAGSYYMGSYRQVIYGHDDSTQRIRLVYTRSLNELTIMRDLGGPDLDYVRDPKEIQCEDYVPFL